ncbi:NFX1-type zinc finger-containing protein 1-like [Ylistrum balloti]|uniref:NFX1-type zinc finger-containing protein 1-like n=1 Tax=Ylistrum balloti TaxID=509963 RepID=UPI002905BE59|nr:NFX1-type zinc finger-containing protein 1-like [Ylistrum balloti]
MDFSQYRAFSDALTQELALIQGPPGTGKTVIALKILEMFLNNGNIWSKQQVGPIIVLSYTNHALDQFLEGIIRMWLGLFADDFLPIHTGNEEYAVETNDIPINICKKERGQGIEDIELEQPQLDDQNLDQKLKKPIIIETKETEKDLRNGIKCWSLIEQTHKQAILKEVKRRLMLTKPMSVAEENQIKDVWDLSQEDRWRLYTLWIQKILNILQQELMSVQRRYENTCGKYKEYMHLVNVNIYKSAKIVAMTTSRAAADHEILRRINSKIMIIEEAAEVPDHHILACLLPSLQHLVMIGDNQQLRPSYNDYKTAKRYDLDVSIFERLVTSGLPFQQLQFQHRMRPEISDLLTPSIYKELHNHASVVEIEDVRGMERNVYFLNHNVKEHADSDKDLKSHKNQHEVDFIAKLYRYLRLQGYGSRDITVLTTYKEQERLLKIAIRDVEETEHFYEVTSNSSGNDRDIPGSSTAHLKSRCKSHTTTVRDVDNAMLFSNMAKNIMEDENARVTTVDNFQGEENKIILLSLVRSNSKGNIGFLRESNRICVALSRAKAGLYVIGDCTLLREKNDLWRKILQKADFKGIVGTSLTLRCRNHPQNKTEVSHANDFQNVEDGGCSLKCSARLACGHYCFRKCHTYDPNHSHLPCLSFCQKLCSSGHKCQSKCFGCREKCSPCMFEVSKVLPLCRHTVKVPCSEIVEEFLCTERCEQTLQCGHQCQQKCGFPCNTNKNCNEQVRVKAVCGHMVQTACHTKQNPICKVKCSEKLECGHFCKGTCQSCFAGALHQKCREKTQYKQQCGHTIIIDCILSYWDQKYDGNFLKCRKSCEWRCEHEACEKSCGEPCTRQPCNIRCSKKLSCRHLCELLLCDHNGDHWCRKCSRVNVNGGLRTKRANVRNPHHIRLKRCGCVFETEVLDNYLFLRDYTVVDVPRCPNCQFVITDMRYFGFIRYIQWSRFNAELDADTLLNTEILNRCWKQNGYQNYCFPRWFELQRRQEVRSRQCHTTKSIELQAELFQCICSMDEVAKRYNSDVSFKWDCSFIIDQLCERIRRDQNIFSAQELRELALVLPRLATALKSCILRSRLQFNRKTEEICFYLEKCGDIYNKNFVTHTERVETLEPGIFDRIDLGMNNNFDSLYTDAEFGTSRF